MVITRRAARRSAPEVHEFSPESARSAGSKEAADFPYLGEAKIPNESRRLADYPLLAPAPIQTGRSVVPLPEPPKWDPRDPRQWGRSIAAWAALYRLSRDDVGPCVESYLMVYLDWAVSNDARASRLLRSLGGVGFDEMVSTLVSSCTVNPVNEAQEAYDKLNSFRFEGSETLRAGWVRFKGLVLEAQCLRTCPPNVALSALFYRALQSSRHYPVAMQLRFKFPDEIQIPWEGLAEIMDMLSVTWDFKSENEKVSENVRREKNKLRTCHNCKKYGHFAKECPDLKTRINAIRTVPGEPSEPKEEAAFLVDTGAGTHVFGERL